MMPKNVQISLQDDFERAVEEDNRRMAQASLQDVHQQNPIQRIMHYRIPNQPQVYSTECQQQQQNNAFIDFLSPPQQLLQRQHNDVIPPQVPLPQNTQQLMRSVRQSRSPIQNQQLDSWMARRLFTPSSGSSSFNLERELELIMTPPRKQQQ